MSNRPKRKLCSKHGKYYWMTCPFCDTEARLLKAENMLDRVWQIAVVNHSLSNVMLEKIRLFLVEKKDK